MITKIQVRNNEFSDSNGTVKVKQIELWIGGMEFRRDVHSETDIRMAERLASDAEQALHRVDLAQEAKLGKPVMSTLFSFKTPIEEMHTYPVGDNLQYCFTPETFKYGLLGMHPIERTFIKDNKQFWREVVKSNIKQLKRLKNNIGSLNEIINDGEQLSPDQSNYYQRLKEEINNHTSALHIARERCFTGFGLQISADPFAKKLSTFYTRLAMWVCISENNLFRGNVVEEALGIIQKRIYHTEPHEGCCGINNSSLLKGILADINTNNEYKWLFNLAIFTESLSERLATLVRSTGYTSPSFNMTEHFHN